MFNYIGSKSKLLDFIDNAVEKADIKKKKDIVLCDLFAGTGAVGSHFRQKGNYRVIANDMFFYSYVINKHFIEGSQSNIDMTLFDMFNELPGSEGFVYNNYCEPSGRLYFTAQNGKRIDAIRIELERLHDEKKINLQTYCYYLSCLLQSTSSVSNTAGVYASYLKKFQKSALKELILRPIPIIEGIKGKVYNKNSEILIDEIEGDILYLDPPYNSRQYGSYYHVLETIAKYDSPTLRGITGMRDYERSNFCIKAEAASALEYVIKKAKFKHILLSYSDEGILSFDDIKAIMSKYGRNYKKYTIDYKRYKFQKDVANDTVTESIHYISKDFGSMQKESLIGTDKLKRKFKFTKESPFSRIDAVEGNFMPTLNTDKIKGTIKIDDLKGILIIQ